MPLYEYKCASCGKTLEVIQKFSDEPLKIHAECGGTLEKLFSAPAFHLKGTGWYATDYGKGNGKPAKSEDSKSEKSEKSDSDSKSKAKAESTSSTTESKSESKPAAASTESKPSSAS